MDHLQFWRLIEAARAESGGDCRRQVILLTEILTELPEQDIVRFEQILGEHMAFSHNWDLWAAAFIINGGCSDDCFDYFRGWLIGQGAAVFYSAFRDPESLVSADID